MTRQTNTAWLLAVSALVLGTLAGCASDPKDRFGRTYYIDGAGNWGFGVVEISEGLAAAGYRGSIRSWQWSRTFNPALDQTIGRVFARSRGEDLGREISDYMKEYPDAKVNIIALSAGTGVAIWACETCSLPGKVNNVILLGSSLSSKYDVRKAQKHIEGCIYVYYSPHDAILEGPVRALGTIDGSFDTPAGSVGLQPLRCDRSHIVNIGWSPKYEKYGWTGAHTDATSEPFVRAVLAKHIVDSEHKSPTTATASTGYNATLSAKTPQR